MLLCQAQKLLVWVAYTHLRFFYQCNQVKYIIDTGQLLWECRN